MTTPLQQFPIPGTLQSDCRDISLALWGNSKVLLVGGLQHGARLRTIRIFNLSNHRWSALSPCRLQTARANSAVLVVNEHLYVFGGTPESSTYEIVDLKVSTVTELPQPMSWHHMKCVAYQERKIFLLGGCDENQGATNECWCFDITTRKFQRLSPMGTKRCLPAVGLYNDSLIIAGGLDEYLDKWQPSAETYHIPTDTWNVIEDMPVADRILTSHFHHTGRFVVSSKDFTTSYYLVQQFWRAKAISELAELASHHVDCRAIHNLPRKDLLVWTTRTNLMTFSTKVSQEPCNENESVSFHYNPKSAQNGPERQRTGPMFKDQAMNVEVPMVVATAVNEESNNFGGPHLSLESQNEARAINETILNHHENTVLSHRVRTDLGIGTNSYGNSRTETLEESLGLRGRSVHFGPDQIFSRSEPLEESPGFQGSIVHVGRESRTEPLTSSLHHTSLIAGDGSMEEVGSLCVDSIRDPSRVFQMRQGKPYFFIAHYGEESKEEIARPTHWFLTNHVKVDVFMDDAELEWGGHQPRLLLQHAYECSHALVLLSPSFQKSKECVRELNSFMDRWKRRDGVRIIPALWRTEDVQGYCEELRDIVWLRSRFQSTDAADYMVSTLWPKILSVIPNQYRKNYTKFQLERLLASYVRQHRTVVNIPMSLEVLAARYHPHSPCCIS